MRFPIGSGLPGRAWERGCTQVCCDITTSPGFLRSTAAENDGLRRGVAIPLIAGHQLHGVALLLSGDGNHLFRACEHWEPCPDGRLQRVSACFQRADELEEAGRRLRPAPGQGLLGRAWASRRPVIAERFNADRFLRADPAASLGYQGALAIPVLVDDDLRSVALLLW